MLPAQTGNHRNCLANIADPQCLIALKRPHRKLPELSGPTPIGPLNKSIRNPGSKGLQREQYVLKLIMKVNVNIEVYINRYKIKF